MISEMRAPSRLSYGRIPNLVELKDLIATQVESFKWFKSEGLRELFDEINPITDYTGKNFELKFLDSKETFKLKDNFGKRPTVLIFHSFT